MSANLDGLSQRIWMVLVMHKCERLRGSDGGAPSVGAPPQEPWWQAEHPRWELRHGASVAGGAPSAGVPPRCPLVGPGCVQWPRWSQVVRILRRGLGGGGGAGVRCGLGGCGGVLGGALGDMASVAAGGCVSE